MLGSVRTLLAGIIDYAGLFPPAKLELRQALCNYAEYLAGPDAWMLGRFVCPAAQVIEATQLLRAMHLPPGTSPRFSVLARHELNREDFLALREDAARFAAITPDVWEARLPADVLGEDNADGLRKLLVAADEALGSLGAEAIFYEAGVGPGSAVPALMRNLKAHNEGGKKTQIGFKLRTGGLEAAAFPSPEQIAEVLLACRETGLPVKFTAGLHHPVRRFDPGVGTAMYGFFNVFGAALFAQAAAFDADRIRAILLDGDAGHFTFTDTEFGWGKYRIPTDTIRELRKNKVISFGSCSFDEPRDDLRRLGLFPS